MLKYIRNDGEVFHPFIEGVGGLYAKPDAFIRVYRGVSRRCVER